MESPVKTLVVLLISISSLTACGGDPFWLPRAHKITIQQGNLLSESQIGQVTVGMPRADVRTLLGAPVTNTTFHDKRWDYYYTSTPAGQPTKAKRLSLYFKDEVLEKVDRSAEEISGKIENRRPWWERIFAPKRKS